MPDGAPPPNLFARAVVAFLALPGVVAILVPAWIVSADWRNGRGVEAIAILPWTLGAGLLAWCVFAFYRAGRGTLAPWDPPRHLVVSGPYRWSRNPMYVAVMLILAGWATGFPSKTIALYALGLPIAFHLRVVLGEEPWLARTHGLAWTRYQARVRRWL